MSHVIFVHVRQLSQRIKSDVRCIICIKIFFYLRTFFRNLYRIGGNRNELLHADNADQQDHEQMLADLV